MGERRIITKMSEVFGELFHDIIDSNFDFGKTSRYEIKAKLLAEIKKRNKVDVAYRIFANGDRTKPFDKLFSTSALYHAIKDEVNAGRIKKFDFAVSNKGRKDGQNVVDLSVEISFHCTNCGTNHKNSNQTDYDNLNLRIYECPKCKKFGKCIANINMDGINHIKAIVKIDGIRQESFVREENGNFIPIEKPKRERPGYHPPVKSQPSTTF